jgi:hypothetical protein
MAEYVRYRVTAAKVGVTMALLGLISGLAERAQGKQSRPGAKQAAAVDYFLKLDGLTGEERNVFLKLEQKLSSSFYLKAQTDHKFLKLADANKKWLKISDANRTYLKIREAATQYLKITDAVTGFMKLDIADRRYLKIDGVAADSKKLGGMTADQFVQGRGGTFTGAKTVSAGDGSVDVMSTGSPLGILIGLLQGDAQITLVNHTAADVDFVSDQLLGRSSLNHATVKANGGTFSWLVPAVQGNPFGSFHLQFFPSADNKQAMTLIVSTEPGPAGTAATQRFVAQLLIGLL